MISLSEILYFLILVFKVSHFNILASKSGLVVDDKGDKTGKRYEYQDPDQGQHSHGIREATEIRC